MRDEFNRLGQRHFEILEVLAEDPKKELPGYEIIKALEQKGFKCQALPSLFERLGDLENLQLVKHRLEMQHGRNRKLFSIRGEGQNALRDKEHEEVNVDDAEPELTFSSLE